MNNYKICVVGLGYVGLPLVISFSKKYSVVGYDISKPRIEELNSYKDNTNEIDSEILKCSVNSNKILFTDSVDDIKACNVYIITVPTPIEISKKPNLNPLREASTVIGRVLKENDLVIYESTTYPGCTEEFCIPILEENSKLTYNVDFFVGYSPERINPGDKINTLESIKKVTSGSNQEVALIVDKLYNSIIVAGTYMAESIKVAEASKAIENAQRDINISFVNELAIIFDRLKIDTHEVLNAAATKWNFLNFKPGLVGGHCISVDPYYLTYKSELEGYIPSVILSGRRVNENMGEFIASKIIKLMIGKDLNVKNARVLILGFTFKENCPDTRNTKVMDVYNALMEYGVDLEVFDPYANIQDVEKEHNINLLSSFDDDQLINYAAVILAVPHEVFLNYNFRNRELSKSVFFDCKGVIDKSIVDGRL